MLAQPLASFCFVLAMDPSIAPTRASTSVDPGVTDLQAVTAALEGGTCPVSICEAYGYCCPYEAGASCYPDGCCPSSAPYECNGGCSSDPSCGGGGDGGGDGGGGGGCPVSYCAEYDYCCPYASGASCYPAGCCPADSPYECNGGCSSDPTCGGGDDDGGGDGGDAGGGGGCPESYCAAYDYCCPYPVGSSCYPGGCCPAHAPYECAGACSSDPGCGGGGDGGGTDPGSCTVDCGNGTCCHDAFPVCCADGLTCCPSGTECSGDGRCLSGTGPWGGGGCSGDYPIDCGNGSCCPSGTTCVDVGGDTRCAASGGGGGAPMLDENDDGEGPSGEELLDPRNREPRSYCRVGGPAGAGLWAIVLAFLGRSRRRSR